MSQTEEIEGLAGEYVLGSLTAEERREVSRRRAIEPQLDAAIVAWERRLAPLNARVPEVLPPPRIRDQVMKSIEAPHTLHHDGTNVVRLERQVFRWKSLAMASGALAASLLLAFALGWLPRPVSSGAQLVAVLSETPRATNADEPIGPVPTFVITVDEGRASLRVKQVLGRPATEGRSYVLWLIPSDGGAATFISWIGSAPSSAQLGLDSRRATPNPSMRFGVSIETRTANPPAAPGSAFIATGLAVAPDR